MFRAARQTGPTGKHLPIGTNGTGAPTHMVTGTGTGAESRAQLTAGEKPSPSPWPEHHCDDERCPYRETTNEVLTRSLLKNDPDLG